MTFRKLLIFVLFSSQTLGLAGAASDDFPSQTIRIVSPFTAGGGNDVVARTVAAEISKQMGQSVLVDNRPGANSIVGMELVARAAPNGYLLVMGSSALAVNVSLYRKLPFDTLKDFSPVVLAASTPFVLAVHPSLPVRSVKELIVFAKRRPGELSYPSSGVGNSTHLAGELFAAMAGVNLVHVPYKGTGPGLTDLIAGRLSLVFNAPASLLTHVNSGRLRALAVTSPARSTLLPELPTIAEAALPGYQANTWHGILAPANTPNVIVARLNAEVVRALGSAQVKQRFAAVGVEAQGGTPEAFAQYIQAEITRWNKVIKMAGVQPE